MSTPPQKSDPAVAAWQFAEKVLEEEDDARLATLSEDELRAELEAKAGPAPTRAWSLDEALAATAARAGQRAKEAEVPVAEKAPPAASEPPLQKIAPVVPIRRSPWRTVAIALAAGFALVVGFRILSPPPIVAVPPDPVAEEMRKKAFAACEAKDWAACRQGLDEAAARDPVGDRTLDVRRAREAMAASVAGDGGRR